MTAVRSGTRWRQVPQPAAIAALPTDKRGFPVPWVSDWSSNRAYGAQWPNGQIVGECSCVIGQGTPNLGAVCTTRQKRGMTVRLCGTCGEPLGAVGYFLGALAGSEANPRGLFTEVPVHRACAVYAGRVCPGLVTVAAKVGVVEARTWETVAGKFMTMAGEDVVLSYSHATPVPGAALLVLVVRPHPVRSTPLEQWIKENTP